MESQTVSGIRCFTAGYREKLHRMRIAEFKSVSPGANQGARTGSTKSTDEELPTKVNQRWHMGPFLMKLKTP
jgi:hypothetical protein